jgi:hypothetical protein
VPVAGNGGGKQTPDALGNWKWDEERRKVEEDCYGLPIGSWQHVLFTYNHGRGVLYVNGMEIVSRDDVTYMPSTRPLVAGNNSVWWFQTNNGSPGLNGALADLVWFNRALTAEEAGRLANKTKPQTTPRLMNATTVVIRTKWVAIESLPELRVEERREVLDTLLIWDKEKLVAIQDVLVRLLPVELLHPDTCYAAARLLERLGSDAATHALHFAVPQCVAALSDDKLTVLQRAEAALSLGVVGDVASQQAKPALMAALKQERADRVDKPVRVEDVLSNACMIALTQVAPGDQDVMTLLGDVMAPLKAASGKAGNFLTELVNLGAKANYISSMEYNGVKYEVGEGIAWKGVETVTPEQYVAIVSRLPVQYQSAAREWAKNKEDYLYRVPLYRRTPDGKTQKVYLEGENFVLYGEDAKMRGWSLFADEKGFIHLIGGQHNKTQPERFIPGSWETMGVTQARQMYWVSQKPESIDSFEFVGAEGDPRAIPAWYLNYLVIRKSFDGRNVLVCRINHYDWQSWGAFLYDSETKRWSALGGDACLAYRDATEADPLYSYYAPRDYRWRVVDPSSRGHLPEFPGDQKALAWSWSPAFYNYCRDNWSIRFDRTGRMHVKVNLFGVQEEGFYHHSKLYAYSDDMGKTFYRADGRPVELPLTSIPAPAYNASLDRNRNGQWLELWLDVLRLAGVEPKDS